MLSPFLCLVLYVAEILGKDFGDLLEEAKIYRKAVFAEATKACYRSQLTAFLRYCKFFNRIPLPANQLTLVGYLVFLARSLNTHSIPGYLNIIRILHLNAGLKNPLQENWEISMIKRAINRLKGQPPVQKEPITLEMLLAIRRQLNLLNPLDACFWCACLIAFYGFLRKSSLLPKNSKAHFRACLCRFDVNDLSTNSFSLNVRNSKTIQFGQKVLAIPFAACENSILCPVRALVMHLSLAKLNQTDLLFSSKVGNVKHVLTQPVFTRRLKELIGKAGFNSGTISPHSFRRGGTSFAINAGINPLIIKCRGDWSSNAFEKYVFLKQNSTMAAAKVISRCVSKFA